jgi:hypothetical protein
VLLGKNKFLEVCGLFWITFMNSFSSYFPTPSGTYDILRSAETGESVLMSDWRDFRTRRGSLSINVHELTDEVGFVCCFPMNQPFTPICCGCIVYVHRFLLGLFVSTGRRGPARVGGVLSRGRFAPVDCARDRWIGEQQSPQQLRGQARLRCWQNYVEPT